MTLLKDQVEKYGYTRKQAADEIDQHMTECEAGIKKSMPAS
jgi:hypothetical protein